MSNQFDYHRVRDYVEQNLQAEKNKTRVGLLLAHSLIFIVCFALAWWAFLANHVDLQGPLGGALIALTFGWGIGLFLHGYSSFTDSRKTEQQLREQLTLRGIQKELMRLGMSQVEMYEAIAEKPKRKTNSTPSDPALVLSDDGELVPLDEDDLAQQPVLKSAHRSDSA